MSMSDWIALSALLVSILSVFVSVYLYQKDRGRLRAWAILNYGDPSEGHRPVLEVKAVNIGRRPILLDWLLLDFESTGRHGTQLADSLPLKLDEGETIEKTLRPTDPCLFNDANDYAKDIHVGDTLGRAYPVKHARKLLREYQRIYKDEVDQWKKL
jgi:hypothetical protein